LHFDKVPQHTSLLSGQNWFDELMAGHNGRFYNEMGIALGSLKDVLRDGFQLSTRSNLDIETKALKAIQKDEGFSQEDLACTAMAIAEHPGRANAYLGLDDRGSRKTYILSLMEKLRNGH
jgi:hypothetical protein